MKDLFGKALLNYQMGNYTEDIITWSSVSGEDILPLPYLFRDYKEMPALEQKALGLAYGKVLDIGCGSGSHSLYLQNKGLDVKAIDISKGAVKTCKLRGIKNVENINVFDLKNKKFDTILALMNGAGMSGRLEKLTEFLSHLKSLLKSGGQILTDSSDISYMFEDEEYYYEKSSDYYGEVIFTVAYKDETDEPFNWMYVDFNTLKKHAKACGLSCELVQEGEHFDYLARLT
jgi:methylase of polypeptide subunit release factors